MFSLVVDFLLGSMEGASVVVAHLSSHMAGSQRTCVPYWFEIVNVHIATDLGTCDFVNSVSLTRTAKFFSLLVSELFFSSSVVFLFFFCCRFLLVLLLSFSSSSAAVVFFFFCCRCVSPGTTRKGEGDRSSEEGGVDGGEREEKAGSRDGEACGAGYRQGRDGGGAVLPGVRGMYISGGYGFGEGRDKPLSLY